MPPRIILPRSLCPIRSSILPRRTFTTTSFPTSKSVRIPIITGTVVLGVGVGLFSLSRVSHAETQPSKALSDREELTARVSRKPIETPGKAEEANKSGGSSEDNKHGVAVESKKSKKDPNRDSKTGKLKGGHGESGHPKDDRLAKKSEKETNNSVDEDAEKDDSPKSEETHNENQEGEEEGEVGRGPVGIFHGRCD